MDANEIAIGIMMDKADVLNAPAEARRKLAIASVAQSALQGMLSNPALTPGWNPVTDTTGPARYAFVAVAYATALVDELERTEAETR